MDCKTAQHTLPLYFDNELDRAASREFEAHLDSCADCRAALIELDNVRRALRDEAPRYTAPELLRKRIEKLALTSATATPGPGAPTAASSPIAPVAVPRRRAPRWLAYAASTTLAFFAGGTAVSLLNSPGRTPETASATASAQLARDLFASHWRALAATSPVDVVSTDRHTVKPWFEGKIGIAPVVQDFVDQGFALVGGRIDYVGTERVAVLVYRHGQHLIDVFVLAPEDTDRIGISAVQNGYRLESIHLGDQPAAIVTDMDAGELVKFDQLLQQTK